MTYPIIIIPSKVAHALEALPPSPPFDEIPPIAPTSELQPLSVGSMGWEVVGLIVLTCVFGIANLSLAFFIFLLGAFSITLQIIKEKKSYSKRYKEWQFEISDYERKKELYIMLQQQHELLVQATRMPEKITKFRQQSILRILNKTVPNDGNNSTARRGYSESLFEPYLNQYFPGKIHTGLTLTIPGFKYPYTADFTYVDLDSNLYIDIEIDEPYSYKSGKPTHYQGSWRDDNRNNFFLYRQWIIIRFAEEQVVTMPSSCCKELAATISKITFVPIPSYFSDVPDLPPVNHWTLSEAELMAAENSRDKLLRKNP